MPSNIPTATGIRIAASKPQSPNITESSPKTFCSAPGPAKWDLAAIAVGAVFYVLFVWKLHVWLIGVPVA